MNLKRTFGFLLLGFFLFFNSTIENKGATFTVTKVADSNDNICNSDCSLREAVAAATATASDDTVEFSPDVFGASQTITLTNGRIDFSSSGGAFIISGPGANLLKIESVVSDERHFNLLGNAVVTINGITFSGRGQSGFGGGIETFFASLSLNNSRIVNCLAQHGGAIRNGGGTMRITNSTLSNNSTTAAGGGVLNSIGSLEITNSTISNNSASSAGGGIQNINSGTIIIKNATISGNSISGSNGAAGLSNTSGAGLVTIADSIIADNSAANAPDVSGNLSSNGYNLIENTNGANISGNLTGNIVGQDPQLLPLRGNDNSIQLVRLLPSSPAIDTGNPNSYLETDQRGVLRPQDGDLNGSARPDIGAYERKVTLYAVTKPFDTNDGVCDSDCSLREAIAATNTSVTPDNAIVFSAQVFTIPQTITLILGELNVNNNANSTLLINGNNLLTISGNNQSRVFFNNDRSALMLQNLIVKNGFANIGLGVGGGVLNNGSLQMERVIISENTGNSDGGGIYNNGIGSMSISNSIVRDNTAPSQGGGLYNSMGGSVLVKNSTITGNRAVNNGGGISNGADMIVTNSTISSNSSNQRGGGIYHVNSFSRMLLIDATVAKNTAQQSGGGVYGAAQVEARNSIFADNSSLTANSAPDFLGNLFSNGFNLIESVTGTTINGNSSGNIIGQDPQLLPLGNYGGLTPTHSLRKNSPAIDRGNSFGLIFDQRERQKPYDFADIPNAPGSDASDIGAFERQSDDRNGLIKFDYDGDGKADVSVFRPVNGTWYLNNSTGGFSALTFGISTDRTVPADYDGDGKTDIAVFRDGYWYFLRSSDNSFSAVYFGQAGDIPQTGDFDGDGRADQAVYRDGIWYLNRSTQGFAAISFGLASDKLVAADYDGDGKTDVAVYRDGNWYYLRSSDNSFAAVNFGLSSDIPVPADYDGDGKTDQAVYRNGNWYILQSASGFAAINFGLASDKPVPADYDGDGKTDVAVYRNGNWYIQQSSNGFTAQIFGQAGDLPTPNAFVPR